MFIAGGARLYEDALPMATRLEITDVGLWPKGDTYFPPWEHLQHEVFTFEDAKGHIQEQKDKPDEPFLYSFTSWVRGDEVALPSFGF